MIEKSNGFLKCLVLCLVVLLFLLAATVSSAQEAAHTDDTAQINEFFKQSSTNDISYADLTSFIAKLKSALNSTNGHYDSCLKREYDDVLLMAKGSIMFAANKVDEDFLGAKIDSARTKEFLLSGKAHCAFEKDHDHDDHDHDDHDHDDHDHGHDHAVHRSKKVPKPASNSTNTNATLTVKFDDQRKESECSPVWSVSLIPSV